MIVHSVLHNTTQKSSDNLSFYPRTIITAQMLSNGRGTSNFLLVNNTNICPISHPFRDRGVLFKIIALTRMPLFNSVDRAELLNSQLQNLT